MLQRLSIRNYAIINEIEVHFEPGLNIITGETGAGKSILVGALGLVLGHRADSSVLMNKEKKTVVEALFDTGDNKDVNEFLTLNELDITSELFLRREISPNGKSRVFINDTPVNLNQLKALSSLLVDLHQQFDTLELANREFQRTVLDAMADNSILLQEYTQLFLKYSIVSNECKDLQARQANATKELDYNQFLFNELEEAALKENELEDLDTELKLLSNAGNIKQQLSNICYELNQSEQPIVRQLKVLGNKLHSLEEFHKAIPLIAQRIREAQIELADIASELENIEGSIQYSPDRIQWVNDKINTGYKLLKKHHVNTTAELLEIKNTLQVKLDDIVNLSTAIAQKEQEVNVFREKAELIARKLSINRKNAIKPFVEKVNHLLTQVGMPNARINVRLEEIGFHIYGTDSIEFVFDANKSNRFEPLRKVASGGELSRLMLCIKSLVAKKLKLPTLIFDEIDTGISGEAARQIGIIMKGMCDAHQVIAITHQPQIAARADAHYFVYKAIDNDAIITSIRLLDNDERITTIARMLSGEKPTAAALENAREMVRN